jgi:hypothetical protein
MNFPQSWGENSQKDITGIWKHDAKVTVQIDKISIYLPIDSSSHKEKGKLYT